MNLDDLSSFKNIDTLNMLGHIDTLPGQLEKAWKLGKDQPLPDWKGIDRIVITGMGGSAIGADLLIAYTKPMIKIPITVNRDYTLPAWARGENTLVVASSHSGNTEETISSLSTAIESRCRCLVVTTGGLLAEIARSANLPLWKFVHEGQPRAAVGFSFTLLLSLLWRLGFLSDPSQELIRAIETMRKQQEKIQAESTIVNNLAKRMAGQMMDRYVHVIGSGYLTPVARRWKTQVNEIAKASAQFEDLPEANHNTLAGNQNPEGLMTKFLVIFLRAVSDHPRNQLRAELTKKTFMLEGIGTDFVDAQGETPLANMWSLLHFGDYTSFYLAMLYAVDPTNVAAIEMFKTEMADAEKIEAIETQ